MSWFSEIANTFDIIIAILLLITIGYAFRLNQRLNILRDAREGMEEVLSEFSAALDQAEASVQGLKGAAGKTAEVLKERLEKADRMADDLALMEKRGELACRKLEELIALSRHRQGAAQDAPAGAWPPKATAGRAESPRSETRPNPAPHQTPGASTQGEALKGPTANEEQAELLKLLQGMR